MLNSGMDWAHNHQGILSFFSLTIVEEGTMITRFHGIDRHNKYSTIAVVDLKGEEIAFEARCSDLKGYIEKLGPEDAVILEASTGAFYWADRVESRGSVCYVIDPHRFRIIKDSWHKTANSTKWLNRIIEIWHRHYGSMWLLESMGYQRCSNLRG
jgi:hypothetical protein